jgi:predicted DNA-binding transcriptional regulator AlpA
MTAAATSNWYTADEVARLFEVTKRTVWRWEQQGKVPKAVRKGKRWTRWRRGEVDAAIQGGKPAA